VCQHSLFSGIGGQAYGTAVGGPNLVGVAEVAEQFGPGGVTEVAAVQRRRKGVQFGHCRLRPGMEAQSTNISTYFTCTAAYPSDDQRPARYDNLARFFPRQLGR
jgi:hypothetical protein